MDTSTTPLPSIRPPLNLQTTPSLPTITSLCSQFVITAEGLIQQWSPTCLHTSNLNKEASSMKMISSKIQPPTLPS